MQNTHTNFKSNSTQSFDQYLNFQHESNDIAVLYCKKPREANDNQAKQK